MDLVSAGDARHGRRDNGLVAAEYAAAGDVDPRVGEHLLDVLALQGIAAYLRPSSDLHPVTRQTSLPARPIDRLYVDRAHLATARDYLARLARESEEAEAEAAAAAAHEDAARGGTGSRSDVADTALDDAWAEIMASYDAVAERSWPDAEDVSTDRDEPDQHSPRQWRPPRHVSTSSAEADPPSLLDALDTFGANLPDDDEEGFTPPPAPPVPRPSTPTVLAIIGVVAGLVIFLKPDLLPFSEGFAMVLGFASIVTGFATLVWRLRPGDEEDADPDDGARV